MKLRLDHLAALLRRARENAGLSQQAVAEALGLPRTAVTAMESGKRSVSTLELTKLGELFRRPVADFLPPFEEEAGDPLVVLHRLEPGFDADPEVRESVERCVRLCRVGAQLEELLGRSTRLGPPTYPVPAPRTPWEAIEQGGHIAAEERQRLSLGDAPVAGLAEMISSQGVWACGAELPNEMSGLFLRHASLGSAVVVNRRHSLPRRRFSFAHEYAHALADRELGATVSTAKNAGELAEKRANAFAACFLMPSGGVADFLHLLDKARPSREVVDLYEPATEAASRNETRSKPATRGLSYQDVAQLAHHFGVSYRAATFRLKNLEWINQTECEQLLGQEQLGRQFVILLDSHAEEVAAAREAPDRELRSQVLRLAIEAFRREEISRGRLLEIGRLVGVDRERLLQQADASRN